MMMVLPFAGVDLSSSWSPIQNKTTAFEVRLKLIIYLSNHFLTRHWHRSMANVNSNCINYLRAMYLKKNHPGAPLPKKLMSDDAYEDTQKYLRHNHANWQIQMLDNMQLDAASQICRGKKLMLKRFAGRLLQCNCFQV